MKWTRLDQSSGAPPARSSHALSSFKTSDGDELLLLFGGESEPRTPVPTDVWLYSMNKGIWSRVESVGCPPPCPRFGHTMATVASGVLVFGGRTEVAEQSSLNDLYHFNVSTATWKVLTPVPGSPVPPLRNYHASTSDGDHLLWIFGGCGTEGRLNDMWQFDMRTLEWTQLPTNPDITGRGGPGFAYVNNALWVIGGFSGKEMGDFYKFDLEKNQWESISTPITTTTEDSNITNTRTFTARSVFAIAPHPCSSCSHSNHITVFGGEIDPSDAGHAGAGAFASDLLCLDTSRSTWHSLDIGGEEAPGPRGWTAAAPVGKGIVVSGGVNLENERVGELWLLELH